MVAVVLRGTPVVENPVLVKKVRALAIDETKFLSAKVDHPTIQSPASSFSAARE
jgi:hypothetical protein